VLPPRAASKASRASVMVPTAGDWRRDPAPRPGRSSRPSWYTVPAVYATAVAMRGMARSIAISLTPLIAPAPAYQAPVLRQVHPG